MFTAQDSNAEYYLDMIRGLDIRKHPPTQGAISRCPLGEKCEKGKGKGGNVKEKGRKEERKRKKEERKGKKGK